MEAGVRLSGLPLYHGHFLQYVTLPPSVTSLPKAVDLNKNVFWVLLQFKSLFKRNYSACVLVILLQYWPQDCHWFKNKMIKSVKRSQQLCWLKSIVLVFGSFLFLYPLLLFQIVIKLLNHAHGQMGCETQKGWQNNQMDVKIGENKKYRDAHTASWGYQFHTHWLSVLLCYLCECVRVLKS